MKFIKLKNQLDNPIYINPLHIVTLEVCELVDVCDMTLVDAATHTINYPDNRVRKCYLTEEKGLGVQITFTTGKTLIVKECLREIREKINEN